MPIRTYNQIASQVTVEGVALVTHVRRANGWDDKMEIPVEEK